MLEDSDGQKHSNGIYCSARVMVTRTIELDRNDLDKSIEVLSSAAQTLKLTRFERLSYRALMLTADVAAVGYLARFLIAACLILFGIEEYSILLLVFGALVELVAFVGIVALMLNIPAFVRIFRERARVQTTWSQFSLQILMEGKLPGSMDKPGSWVPVNRHRCGARFEFGSRPRIPGACWVSYATWNRLLIVAVEAALPAGLLFAARFLRDQRERMELTANAEELRKAFQSLRQRSGKANVVTVPSELLEQTAKIELAQIARERKDAVLQSITLPSKRYAVAFDGNAVEQRATLNTADRVELEELVEQIGADAAGTRIASKRQSRSSSSRNQKQTSGDQLCSRSGIPPHPCHWSAAGRRRL